MQNVDIQPTQVEILRGPEVMALEITLGDGLNSKGTALPHLEQLILIGSMVTSITTKRIATLLILTMIEELVTRIAAVLALGLIGSLAQRAMTLIAAVVDPGSTFRKSTQPLRT